MLVNPKRPFLVDLAEVIKVQLPHETLEAGVPKELRKGDSLQFAQVTDAKGVT